MKTSENFLCRHELAMQEKLNLICSDCARHRDAERFDKIGFVGASKAGGYPTMAKVKSLVVGLFPLKFYQKVRLLYYEKSHYEKECS